MKLLHLEGTSEVQESAIAKPPAKVGMYVVGEFRTDVRVMREATTLQEAGYDVSIVDVVTQRNLPAQEEINGIKVKHISMPDWFTPTPQGFKLLFLIKLMQVLLLGLLKLLSTSADIYHAHDENALPSCYITALIRRKPLIYDAHELPLSDPAVTRWRRLHALSTYLLGHMVRYCVGIITVSPPIAQRLSRSYLNPKVTLVRNVPPLQIAIKSDRLRQKLALSENTRIALYQGNLQSDRGLDRLIKAARFLEQDIVIVIMGKDKEGTQAQLEALMVSEGVTDRVKIIPPVPYAELLEWTSSADLGLIIYASDYSPNIEMCLPNKLFEYLMAGVPVLASALDAVTEILKEYDAGGIVTSLMPKDIGVAINAMLADPSSLTRMHNNALIAVQKDLCWEQERNRLIDLYKNLLSK